jgi:hypothetical protein
MYAAGTEVMRHSKKQFLIQSEIQCMEQADCTTVSIARIKGNRKYYGAVRIMAGIRSPKEKKSVRTREDEYVPSAGGRLLGNGLCGLSGFIVGVLSGVLLHF